MLQNFHYYSPVSLWSHHIISYIVIVSLRGGGDKEYQTCLTLFVEDEEMCLYLYVNEFLFNQSNGELLSS